MRLSAQQANYLLVTLRDTLTFSSNMFSYTKEQRQKLYNDILNQQDKIIRSLDDLDNFAAPVLQQRGENNTKGESNAGINDNEAQDQDAATPKEGD